MKTIDYSEAVKFFVPDEGELIMINGRIGNGKTYAATWDAIEKARRGQVVYVTWHIDWSGFDQRRSFAHAFWNFITFNSVFVEFDRSNIRYLDVFQENIWEILSELNNCTIYFDDVIVHLFDSYEGTKFAKEKRQWAFVTRHFDRTIVLVTQRANQVQVALRSQVNRFFLVRKTWSLFFTVFCKYEYDAFNGETVDYETEPVSRKVYIGRRAIFRAYRTKNMRSDVKPVLPEFRAYSYGFFGRFWLLVLALTAPLRRVFSKKKNTPKEGAV